MIAFIAFLLLYFSATFSLDCNGATFDPDINHNKPNPFDVQFTKSIQIINNIQRHYDSENKYTSFSFTTIHTIQFQLTTNEMKNWLNDATNKNRLTNLLTANDFNNYPILFDTITHYHSFDAKYSVSRISVLESQFIPDFNEHEFVLHVKLKIDCLIVDSSLIYTELLLTAQYSHQLLQIILPLDPKLELPETSTTLQLILSDSSIDSALTSIGYHSEFYSMYEFQDLYSEGPTEIHIRRNENGYYVTPIHATLIGNSGKVLLTGWARSDYTDCRFNGTRKIGITFEVDPTNLLTQDKLTRIIQIEPIDEKPRNYGEVLYCGGHISLPGGIIFYTGGAIYQNLGQPGETENGLDYARLFYPNTSSFTRVDYSMPIGKAWYPTNTLLPSGLVLVSGGFFSMSFPAFMDDNTGLTLFSLNKFINGKDPWVLLFTHQKSEHLIAPGIRAYIHTYVLFEPVKYNNKLYTIALLGRFGKWILLNLDESKFINNKNNVQSDLQFYHPPNGARPNNRNSNQSTSCILDNGELLLHGDDDFSGWIDIYNPNTDTWRSLNALIGRTTLTSIILPDSTILFINGESNWNRAGPDIHYDPRYMQIYNPKLNTITTINVTESLQINNITDSFRSFHQWAILLKDASILVGGGVHPRGRVGCEQNNVRIYKPPYLFKGPTPDIIKVFGVSTHKSNDKANNNNNNIQLDLSRSIAIANGILFIEYSSIDNLRSYSSAVLMALPAVTHQTAQNQRMILLDEYTCANQSINTKQSYLIFKIPNIPKIIPGEHLLYLISDKGVPSESYYLTIENNINQFNYNDQSVCNDVSVLINNAINADNSSKLFNIVWLVSGILGLVITVFIILIWIIKKLTKSFNLSKSNNINDEETTLEHIELIRKKTH